MKNSNLQGATLSATGVKTRETTYAIFSKYITYSNGICDTSKIFSKKCFQEWLSSQLRVHKNAGESFRRALISQITASDGRKPFSPEVEASLLLHLRRRKIWDCFENTDITIGKHGFKKLGYHEQQRLAGNDSMHERHQQKSMRDSNTPSQYKHEHDEQYHPDDQGYGNVKLSSSSETIIYDSSGDSILRELFSCTTFYDFHVGEGETYNDKVENMEEHLSDTVENTPDIDYPAASLTAPTTAATGKKRIFHEIGNFGRERKSLFEYNAPLQKLKLEKPMSKKLREALASFHGRKKIGSYLEMLRYHTGIDLLGSHITYMMDLNPLREVRFTRDFILPKSHSFNPHKSIKTAITNMTFGIIHIEPFEDGKIFNKNSLSRQLLSFSCDEVQSAVSMAYSIPLLKEVGECWTHQITFGEDRKVHVLLVHAAIVPPIGIKLCYQDVSDEYEEILSTGTIPQSFPRYIANSFGTMNTIT